MGNSNSAELEHPLETPSGSMQALDTSVIARIPTSLRAKQAALQTRVTVTDVATNSAFGLFKSKMLSSRVVLETPQGQVIASVKPSAFSSKYRVFQGEQTDHESFIVHDASGMFHRMLLVAEFTDRKTETPCRIVARGSPSTKVVLCYLERGSPTLSQLRGSDDFVQNQDRYQRVGRIRRESHFTGDDYFIEASAGVDLTVLLLIWHVRHVAERSNTSQNSNIVVGGANC